MRTKEPPLWLCDERVRSGIKAVLELDRCDEEDYRLITERCSMQVWFAEEWEVVNLAMEEAGTSLFFIFYLCLSLTET